MNPEFSICIPAYNAGNFISATVESVLAQTFRDYEIVILDNASTDNTKVLLERYSDNRIRIITNSETLPAHENWTQVISLARGKWIKLLCADDLLRPDALANIYEDLQNNPNVLVHAGLRDVIDDFGYQVKAAKVVFRDGAHLNMNDLVNAVLKSGTNPLGEPVCLTWNKCLNDRVGPFSDRWKYFIDLDFWLRLSKETLIYYSSEVIGSFRVSSGSWTSSIGFRTSREAKLFFFSREEFQDKSIFLKSRAVLMAFLRTFARQLFLLVILRKNRKEKSI